jgi:radical SAM superfamily enzyme YgiQ (UPF0313 family)
MADHSQFVHENARAIEAFLPFDNPTFGNPGFDKATSRVLIARLSPLRDVDRSLPHLFLFQEVRRALPRAFIDMSFFPSPADRALFDEGGIPYLLGTQSLHSADDFDLVLFSNAYTLELINLPYLLLHSGLPLWSSQRGARYPLLILGGSNAMAAQAIVGEPVIREPDGCAGGRDSLVDGLFFGEGEGRVGRLVSLLAAGSRSRRERLERAAGEVDGFWVAGSSRTVSPAVLYEPAAQLLPVEVPLLNSPEADTAHLQINYGCPAFCTFCFEGYDRKPYRELELDELLSTARRIKQAQGSEELNLYSFNFNTQRDIFQLLPALHRLFERVTFQSQRADILQRTELLLQTEIAADKRSFTLGIEGISARQRAWLHKSLSTADIERLLERLMRARIREVKLFYLLTGHENEDDLAEFRRFLLHLKQARRAGGRRVRVILSFGLLIRMPFTPLRYDRLMLDESDWRMTPSGPPLIGQVKSACETNGFEFRMAFDWETYCTTQVLAMGGHWLADAVVDLAREGYSFGRSLSADATLAEGYWPRLRAWMARRGYWAEGDERDPAVPPPDTLLGEKTPAYTFAFDWVRPAISPEFLYRQYCEARAATGAEDGGYCLGEHCLGCGACLGAEQRAEDRVRADAVLRAAITEHRIRTPEAGQAYLAALRDVMARKRRLRPFYVRIWLEPWLAGVRPETLNAFVFRGLLDGRPELVENLLAVRESLFTVRPNDQRYPAMSGETVFALRAWDAAAVQRAVAETAAPFLPAAAEMAAPEGFRILGPAEGFRPGEFTRLGLDVHLPARHFPEPRRTLEAYLRQAYLPYSLRRQGERRAGRGHRRYDFWVPPKGVKKKVILGGYFELGDEGFTARFDVGPRFDLGAFFQAFGDQHGVPARDLFRYARAQCSDLAW